MFHASISDSSTPTLWDQGGGEGGEEEEDACPASLAIIRRRGADQGSSHPGWESLRDTKECTITASKRGREERGREMGVGVSSAKWERKMFF